MEKKTSVEMCNRCYRLIKAWNHYQRWGLADFMCIELRMTSDNGDETGLVYS